MADGRVGIEAILAPPFPSCRARKPVGTRGIDSDSTLPHVMLRHRPVVGPNGGLDRVIHQSYARFPTRSPVSPAHITAAYTHYPRRKLTLTPVCLTVFGGQAHALADHKGIATDARPNSKALTSIQPKSDPRSA